MSAIARQFFLILLSVSITFAGVPLLPHTPVYAQDTEQNEPEINIDEELQALKDSVYGTKKKNANLDPFLLTRQNVVDERSANAEAAKEETLETDFLERQEHFRAEIVAAEEMLSKAKDRLQRASQRDVKLREDLEVIIAGLKSRIGLANIELEDLKQFDPKEGNPLDLEHMVDMDLRTKHYWGNKMRVVVKSEGEKVLEFKQKDFTQSLSPRFSHENPLRSLDQSKAYTFSLVDPRGNELNHFDIAAEAIFFYGNYLVFIEKDAMESVRGRVKKTLPVRFVDLNQFRSNLGNAPLPVYTMPLKTESAPKEFSIENGRLTVGKQALSFSQFGVLAKTHQMIFNVSVAMVDPATYKKTQPLIEYILEFFGKSMEAQGDHFQDQMERSVRSDSYLRGIMDGLDGKTPHSVESTEATLAAALEDGKISNEEFAKIKQGLGANASLQTANAASHAGKKFFNRVRLFLGELTRARRPEGAAKLLNTILIVANNSKADRQRAFSDRGKMSKLSKFGLAAVGAVAGSALLPESHFLHISQTLDLISASFQHYQGYLAHMDYGRNYAELSKDAFLTSTSGIFRLEFIDAYFTDGKWAPFMYGLGQILLVPVKLFAGIHTIINSYKVLKNSISERRNADTKKEKGLIRSFIRWANKDHHAYWSRRAEAEKQSSGSDISEVSEAEVELLHDHLERLRDGKTDLKSVEKDLAKAGMNPSFITSWFKTVNGFRSKLRFARLFGKKADETVRKTVIKDKDTLIKALSHAFLSYSSLSNTFKANGTFWNKLFFPRSFYYRGDMWLMSFLYPNFAKVAAGELGGKQHLPTEYNSGLDSWPQKLKRAMSRLKATEFGAKIPLPKSFFLSESSLENLGKFEDAMGKLELLAMEVASNKAQRALIEHLDDPERVLVIFASAEREGAVSTGVSTLHDPKLKVLSKTERSYYRAFYTKTFDLVMQRFVNDLILSGEHTKMSPEKFAKEVVKAVKREDIVDFDFTDKEIAAVEADLDKVIDFESIKKGANEIAHNLSKFYSRLKLNFKHNLLRTIHPGNPQIQRQQISRVQLDKPKAMDRAVRMEISSLFSSIPIGIMSSLLLYAGVDSGLLQPFDATGMDTETHLRYMNRYIFYNGFIPGLILGLLANTWMKVQMDYFMDSKGGFDKAIMHKDGKKGFWRFYLRNLVKNPENKWKANHVFSLKLIKANIPAAILTTLAFNAYGLGRFDVGSFSIGYMMIFVTVMSGFGMKVENAFERTSSWVSNKIPRKLRAHPDAQKYIETKLQKRKIAFSWIENVWGIVVEENIAGTMLTLKENAKMGTRSFIRLVFGGETPTNMITKSADMLSSAFKSIPGVEGALEMLKEAVSHNYEATERYPERLLEAGNAMGVERLYEDANLPDNLLAEVVGKLGGAVSTIGAFAGMPYLGAFLLDALSERRVQARGRVFRKDLKIRELERQVAEPVAGSCRSFL